MCQNYNFSNFVGTFSELKRLIISLTDIELKFGTAYPFESTLPEKIVLSSKGHESRF